MQKVSGKKQVYVIFCLESENVYLHLCWFVKVTCEVSERDVEGAEWRCVLVSGSENTDVS